MLQWFSDFFENVCSTSRRVCRKFRARDFTRAATGSMRRAESRTEATSHFARAACLMLCVAVVVRIVFELVLRHRMPAANTVLIIFNQPNSPKKNGPAREGSPIASPNTDRKREGQRPASPFPLLNRHASVYAPSSGGSVLICKNVRFDLRPIGPIDYPIWLSDQKTTHGN